MKYMKNGFFLFLLVAVFLVGEVVWGAPDVEKVLKKTDKLIKEGKLTTAFGEIKEIKTADDIPKDLREEVYKGCVCIASGFLDKNKPGSAQKVYEWALKIFPESMMVEIHLGRTYQLQKKNKEAVQHIEKGLKLECEFDKENLKQNKGYAYFTLGAAYLGLKEDDKAIDALEKAILLVKDIAEAHFLLGVLYYKKKNVDKSIKNFVRGFEIDSKKALPIYYFYLACLYIDEKKEFEKAEKVLKKGLGLMPLKEGFHSYLAYLYYKQDKKIDAFYEYQYELALTSKTNPFLGNLGKFFKKVKEELLRNKESKHYKEIKYFIKGVKVASSKERDVDFKKAIKCFEDALKESGSKNMLLIHYLGTAYLKDMQLDKAIEKFNEVIAKDKYFVPAYIRLADAYYAKKEHKKAIEFYKKAVELKPDYYRMKFVKKRLERLEKTEK